MSIRKALVLGCAVAIVAVVARTCNLTNSGPVNIDTARAELERILQIWVNGEYYTTDPKSMPGKDISRFFDVHLQSNYRLRRFEIESQETSKVGEYKFDVSVFLEGFGISALNGPLDTTKTYTVFKNNKHPWVVLDSRFEAELDKWGFRK